MSGVDIFKFPPADGAPKTNSYSLEMLLQIWILKLLERLMKDLELSVFILLEGRCRRYSTGSAQMSFTLAQVIDQLADDSTVNNAVLVAK